MITSGLAFLSMFVLMGCRDGCAVDGLIVRGKIGPLSLGMAREELTAKFPGQVSSASVKREGLVEAVEIALCDGVSVLAEFEEGDVVSALRTSSPYFRTKSGAKIGDTLSSIMKSHSDAMINFGTEEGPYLSAYIEDLGGYFSFEVDRELLLKLDRERLNFDLIGGLRSYIYITTD